MGSKFLIIKFMRIRLEELFTWTGCLRQWVIFPWMYGARCLNDCRANIKGHRQGYSATHPRVHTSAVYLKVGKEFKRFVRILPRQAFQTLRLSVLLCTVHSACTLFLNITLWSAAPGGRGGVDFVEFTYMTITTRVSVIVYLCRVCDRLPKLS